MNLAEVFASFPLKQLFNFIDWRLFAFIRSQKQLFVSSSVDLAAISALFPLSAIGTELFLSTLRAIGLSSIGALLEPNSQANSLTSTTAVDSGSCIRGFRADPWRFRSKREIVPLATLAT